MKILHCTVRRLNLHVHFSTAKTTVKGYCRTDWEWTLLKLKHACQLTFDFCKLPQLWKCGSWQARQTAHRWQKVYRVVEVTSGNGMNDIYTWPRFSSWLECKAHAGVAVVVALVGQMAALSAMCSHLSLVLIGYNTCYEIWLKLPHHTPVTTCTWWA